MKPTTILIIGALIAGGVLFFGRSAFASGGRALGDGWTLDADGINATGPNGEHARYTGAMTGDDYPQGGMLTL